MSWPCVSSQISTVWTKRADNTSLKSQETAAFERPETKISVEITVRISDAVNLHPESDGIDLLVHSREAFQLLRTSNVFQGLIRTEAPWQLPSLPALQASQDRF